MKNIVGLDLGTNSIGFSTIQISDKDECTKSKIIFSGSRIIPMDEATLSNFNKGNSQSQTAERTSFRSIRRLRERHLLRRERLHKVLHIINYLPKHYMEQIDFDQHPGQIKLNTEPKIAWFKNEQGKYEFFFKDSFNEMLSDFRKIQPSLAAEDKKVPYDWTIYYLRKKALTQKISREEIAWILLNFNQKRGYYQLRGEDEENANKSVEFHTLKIIKVEATEEKKGKDTWYNIYLENGWIYRRTSSVPLEWEGKSKDFIVTTELNEDGNPKLNKYGEVKRSLRAPQPDDWTLRKKKTEKDVENSHETVGCYIYNNLLKDPKQKVKGELIRTIERKFYKKELKEILTAQIKFHPELQDRNIYSKCLDILYPHNESYKRSIDKRDFLYLFIDDIIFYQRPLKIKKSLISNCPFEETQYVDKETGEIIKVPIKCIAKSNPLFQELRLWQFISNLRIYQKEKETDGILCTDVDVTTVFFKSEEDYALLFDWLNDRKDIDEKSLLKYPIWNLKKKVSEYRWNYVSDKTYPCNETRNLILNGLKRASVDITFLTSKNETDLWHILYSVTDLGELYSALMKFAEKQHLSQTFVDIFKKMPPFKKEYGAYSAKAIKKLLPLMRHGKYWNYDQIDDVTKKKISKIITGEVDETINNKVREKAIKLTSENDFKGLPLWLACYIVYGRHSEIKNITKWNNPEDIDLYLKTFKQNTLRNPIVEQIITESLRVVRDIWKAVVHIDEIHIELGREMKKTSKERDQMSKAIATNEATNIRIKTLLTEFVNSEYHVENVRPYSSSQQELLKIYEDEVLSSETIPDDINDIIKKFTPQKMPTKSECMRYKLWLEQKYRSPYTGAIIPLGKLFTPNYEIEHIIPQSIYFDDSFSNKVICESEVNRLKNNQLGYEFIKNHHGEKVPLNYGKSTEIFSLEDYEKFVKEHYSQSNSKKKKLLMDDIPDQFIQRQMNDSRYISKVVMGLLSNVVREKNINGEYEPEATSKNVIACTGSITDRLKRDWGINDIWNDIIYQRFERLNKLTGSNNFGQWENKNGKQVFQIKMPLNLQPGFSKKRIDHRHHAMDAIVIACATRNIVNYLNNESACKQAKIQRKDLQHLICDKKIEGCNYKWIIKKPWDSFTQDTKDSLNNIIVSFKQNLRVVNKATNLYWHYGLSDKKVLIEQKNSDHWAIRKPLHKETVYGLVNLKKTKEVKLSVAINKQSMIVDKELKKKVFELNSLYGSNKKLIEKYFKDNTDLWPTLNMSKIQIYYFTNDTTDQVVAVRKSIDDSFNEATIQNSITDTGTQKILLNHLRANNNDPKIAFSPDGIDEMNNNIIALNNGKYHQPIYKVRKYEPLGNKFSVGETGNKISKYVKAEKGTNLFFGIYQKEDGSRSYHTIPLNIVIERKKENSTPVPEKDDENNKLLFWLSPNDLVYLPTPDELENGIDIENIKHDRIYKIVSFTGNRMYGIPYNIANIIIDKFEFTQLNKIEFTDKKESIKELCVPLKIDRLGRIIKIGNKKI
jgi:CRISPR-associated endonuclease Csn1